MATSFMLPELGENVHSGMVTAVLVKPGDRIEKDQTVVQLETDKAVVDVPSPQAGVVSEVRTKEGATLKVGDVIIVIDGAGPAAKSAPEAKPTRTSTAAPASEIGRASCRERV